MFNFEINPYKRGYTVVEKTERKMIFGYKEIKSEIIYLTDKKISVITELPLNELCEKIIKLFDIYWFQENIKRGEERRKNKFQNVVFFKKKHEAYNFKNWLESLILMNEIANNEKEELYCAYCNSGFLMDKNKVKQGNEIVCPWCYNTSNYRSYTAFK
ncbi:MAG: hypothetical protein ACOCP8_01985 [archaeon]